MQKILIATLILIGAIGQPHRAFAQYEDIFRKYPVIAPHDADTTVITPISNNKLKFTSNYKYYAGDNIPNSGTGLVFPHPLTMKSDTFAGTIDIRKAKFKDDVEFDSVLFSKNTDFTYSIFQQDARFMNCTFQDSVHFCMVNFLEDADFSSSIFGHIAFFSGLNFGPLTSLSFTAATLPDTMDLSDNVTIPQLIELTDANLQDGKICHLFLNRTNISMVHFEHRHFALLFVDPKTRQPISDEEVRSIYQQALQNFKTRGQEDSFQELDIEYRHYLANNIFSRMVDKIQWLWWNYGYWKWLVIGWAVLFILIFSTINYFRLNDLNQNVYTIEGIPVFPVMGELPYSKKRARSRYWYSMVYTSNIFFRLTLDVNKIQFKRVWATFYIFTIYLLGILCLAYMANFVLQK